jgi:hypothetical protein
MALMAIASAVFIYGMVQQFNRLSPQSGTINLGNAQPHALTSTLSYDRKFIHPECTEENGVRHCEIPSEQATPTTPVKPHAQLSPQGSQINSDFQIIPKDTPTIFENFNFLKICNFIMTIGP